MSQKNFNSSNDQIGKVVGECFGTVVAILMTEAIKTMLGGRRNRPSL